MAPIVKCITLDCQFNIDETCTAETIEIDDTVCGTYVEEYETA
jgi:hypothetical protein